MVISATDESVIDPQLESNTLAENYSSNSSISNQEHICVVCGEPATFNCPDCSSAPGYDDQDSSSDTWYCLPGSICHVLHKEKHQDLCEIRQIRKKLGGFCYLVQAAWHLFCRKTQIYRYTYVQRQPGGRLIAVCADTDTNPPAYVQHPPLAPTGEDEQLAIDTFQTCATAARTTVELLRTILNDLAIEIQPLCIRPKNNVLTVVSCWFDDCDRQYYLGHGLQMFADGFIGFVHEAHILIMTTLPNEEAWVIDITSAQYGYKGAFFPWPKYSAERVECPIGNGPVNFDGSLSDLPTVRDDKKYLRLVTEYVKVVEDWCKNRNLASTILGLSADELEDYKQSLLLAIQARLNEVINEFEYENGESEDPRDADVFV